MRNLFVLLLGTMILLGSCQDDGIPIIEIDIDEENFQDNSYNIYNCHNEQDWSIEELEEAVVGEWEYVIGWCGWSGLITPTFDKQTITLDDDGTATIKTDDEEETTTWVVAVTPNSEPRVAVEGIGNFFVCGDKITTYTSPADGCDLTFSKK